MRLNIEDFTTAAGGVPFGLCNTTTAKTLREMADALERGTLLISSPVTIISKADADEFAVQELTLRLHRKKEAPPVDNAVGG